MDDVLVVLPGGELGIFQDIPWRGDRERGGHRQAAVSAARRAVAWRAVLCRGQGRSVAVRAVLWTAPLRSAAGSAQDWPTGSAGPVLCCAELV
jgi:hypothetical protein